MSRSLLPLVALLIALVPHAGRAQGFAECSFGFDIDTQSSAFQSLMVDGEEKRGFWLSINRAPKDVREMAKFIGRLQVCLTTPDGKPRTVQRGGNSFELKSPFVSNCTAALLPGNRLLTNRHCFYDPDLADAGFTVVREARVNFNYTSKDDTGAVRTYLVSNRELFVDEALDAMLLEIIVGDANGDQGGHVPLVMMTEIEPFQELRMIHHPNADPQQYSSGTCQVHRRQSEIPGERSPFRHTCESMGGSSGSLVFDARTMAIVALHNQGGLRPSGDSFNGGHKIAPIAAAFQLGFELYQDRTGGRDPDQEANSALVAALILTNTADKIAALEKVAADFPGTSAAARAATARQALVQDLDNRGAEQRAEEASRALLAALVQSDAALKAAALEAVIRDFAGTSSAAQAETLLAALPSTGGGATPDPEEQAEDALLEALALTDPEQKIAALEAVVRDYATTPAGARAATVLVAILPKPEPPKPPEPTNAQKAEAALTIALAMSDDDRKMRALDRLIRRFPNTPATDEAEVLLAELEAALAPPPEPTLEERMLASQWVQSCDRLGGTPNHPDLETGKMVEPGTPFGAIDGPRAETACRRALDEFPNHPRLMAFLGDVLFSMNRFDEGAPWFQRAAELGDPVAQTSLGFIYYAGRGVPQNFQLGRQWMEKAVAQGYPGAYSALGLYFFEGKAGARDYGRALDMFQRAARGDDPTGYSLLARMYEHGYGTTADPDRAAELYVRALQGGVDWFIASKGTWVNATGRALQRRLQQLGYYNGAIDGAIGPGTRSAMEALLNASLPR